ncbi:MAG: Lrp/AsnC family transcriptional regulator [Promethearchaeota archaeon]
MMSEVFNMDEIDKQIIELVQKQPNLTHTQIASQVNRSQPTVGMRIKRLEKAGVLQFQAGINLKSADLFCARVDFQTTMPEEVYASVKNCPFLVNAFRLSGDIYMSILIVGFDLAALDKIAMDVITDIMSDFILPLDMNFDVCDNCFNDGCAVDQ